MGKILPLFSLLVIIVICTPYASALNETEIKTLIGELVEGGNDETLNVLYMGNSRVARPTGFAFDGLEESVFEQGRLAGNGFVVPFKGIGGSSSADNRYLVNNGYGMTDTPPAWRAVDALSTQHDFAFEGLALIPERSVRMSNLQDAGTLLFKNQSVLLTVLYLAGPGRGSFNITPVEVQGTRKVTFSHPTTTINADSLNSSVMFREIVLSPMQDLNRNRAFVLTGVSENVTIYRVSVRRNVPGGIFVSEMAIGAAGYPEQANDSVLPAESWTAYVASHDPDIVFWQYAGNENPDVSPVINATRTLMDRIFSVQPQTIHVLLIDNPTPRSNAGKIVNNSITWATELKGHHNAIVIDMRSYLPTNFTALAGTCATSCQLGEYFLNSVHENRFGARVVWDAIHESLLYYASH